MVMNFFTADFAVTVHWPSASGTDFQRPQAIVPLVSLPCVVRQFCLLDLQSHCTMVKAIRRTWSMSCLMWSYCVFSYGGS
jgi:hypothetical protein